MGGERGLHGGACPPTCRGRPEAAERAGRKKGVSHPEDEALGRSRGGLTTKLHLCGTAGGRPLSVVVIPGQHHESTKPGAALDAIRVAHPAGLPGRPRKRPERLLADRGYSYLRCRELLRRCRIPHTIPERLDQKQRRAGRPGRPPAFDAAIYSRRN